MPTYANWDIQEMPLRTPFFHAKVKNFLAANDLRLEEVDVYLAILNADGEILAGGGLSKDILKCIAVAPEARSEGLAAPLVSRLLAAASARGIHNLKVFTKPENQAIFESLGFKLLARAPKAILLENGPGLARYCARLRSLRRPGRSGVIVMNANPFTLGHRYLIEQASRQVDTLYVIPVKEDVSYFPYAERSAMIQAALSQPGASWASRVVVLPGSDYVISAATFPTYFLKDLSDAAETQMALDLDLYGRWIAPALDASVRFVGSEPCDALTARYNELMPGAVVIPRLETPGQAGGDASVMPGPDRASHASSVMPGPDRASCASSVMPGPDRASCALSASRVRAALAAGRFRQAAALCPETSWPYLLAALADRALRLELDTPLKPGLVCPGSQGAHSDMDYALMQKALSALRPFWSRMAQAPSADKLRELGIEAESAMMAATGGVNTHRGAIFALGLALLACGRFSQYADNQEDVQFALGKIAEGIFDKQLKDSALKKTPRTGARRMAGSGYRELFEDWLPYYRTQCRKSSSSVSASEENPAGLSAEQKLLLRIMSTLDDTCVIKRVGEARAQQVRLEAKALLEEIPGQAGNDEETTGPTPSCPAAAAPSCPAATGHLMPMSSCPAATGHLREICKRYAAEGISPGGAADMLALTIFIDSIL